MGVVATAELERLPDTDNTINNNTTTTTNNNTDKK